MTFACATSSSQRRTHGRQLPRLISPITSILVAGLCVSACRGRFSPSIETLDATTQSTPENTPQPIPTTPDQRPAQTPPTSLDGGSTPHTSLPMSFAPIVHAVRPAVVSVFAAIREMNGMQWGFNVPQERFSLGRGTGFIISSDGEVLTNNHVIEGAAFIEVQLDDGRRFGANVLGRDPRLDVALLRIKAPGTALTVARLGDSTHSLVGDWVIAIGNPYGLAQTVTTGIISAVGRTGREVHLGNGSFGNLIQTDASINPGNSGGPLLNLDGEVIGINVAIRRGAQGLGFAIPINMAKVVVPQLRQYGRAMRSWLGVSLREVTDQLAQAMRLPDSHGAIVYEVEVNSPAAAAGIQPGDVIRRFDGQTVNNPTQVSWLASSAGIGHRSTVELLRSGNPVTVQVTMGSMPETPTSLPLNRPGIAPMPDPMDP